MKRRFVVTRRYCVNDTVIEYNVATTSLDICRFVGDAVRYVHASHACYGVCWFTRFVGVIYATPRLLRRSLSYVGLFASQQSTPVTRRHVANMVVVDEE